MWDFLFGGQHGVLGWHIAVLIAGWIGWHFGAQWERQHNVNAVLMYKVKETR